jgi:hypothetical protein
MLRIDCLARTAPLSQDSLADCLLIEEAVLEIRARESAQLDELEPSLVFGRQRIEPLQHLLRGKVPTFRLRELTDGWGARVIHGLDAILCRGPGPFRTQKIPAEKRKNPSPKRPVSRA